MNHRCEMCDAPIAPGLREILEYRYEGTGFGVGPWCKHCAEDAHINAMADGQDVLPVRPEKGDIGAPKGPSYEDKLRLMRSW
jgi:hypothetical protein